MACNGGDTVVIEGRYKGKARRTGKAFDAQFAHVWQLRNGKVVSFQQYTETAQWRTFSVSAREIELVSRSSRADPPFAGLHAEIATGYFAGFAGYS